MLRDVTRVPAVLALVFAMLASAAADDASSRKQIERFNQEFTAAILRMDNAAVMSLWAEDGTTLLPGMAPLSGRANISKWLDGVTEKLAGYRVTKQQDDFRDIQVSGDWASEWATTVQVVQPPEGKPAIETHGKILLVLHREKDGKWRIKQEMWNAASAK